ncbi:MAG TPA: hypothetical protein VHL11_02205, partial [Phototrophicaceae bacterium]|nr:hypothetical protein [Phototrophicaceae bacterium]
MLKRLAHLYHSLILLTLIALTASLSTGVFAQDATTESAWTVSLYDHTTGTITRLDSTGNVIDSFVLPVSEGYDFYNYDVVTSPQGNYLAYIVSQVGDGSNPVQPSELIVYDSITNTITGTYDLNPTAIREGVNAASSSLHFSDDGQRVVASYYIPVGAGESTMQFVVLDTATGEVVATMTGDQMSFMDVDVSNTAYTTQVIAFHGQLITMLLRPVFVAENLQSVVVTWNLDTGEVLPAASDLIGAVDYFPARSEVLL